MEIGDKKRELRKKIEALSKELPPIDLSDVNRLSIQAHQKSHQNLPGREIISTGNLHLTGEGVTGHSAELRSVGSVMEQFQNLVDAAGASIQGSKSVRGRVPESVTRKTSLLLTASPSPGSLNLDFHPAIRPQDELSEDGSVPLIEDSDQLVDKAMRLVFATLDEAVLDEVVPEHFASRLLEAGPRFAAALQRLSSAFARASFDADLSWAKPHEPTMRVSASEQNFARIAKLIQSRELSVEEVEVVGAIKMISVDRGLRLETIEDGAPSEIQISKGKLSREVIDSLNTSMIVKVRASLKLDELPGGGQKEHYEAIDLEFS